MKGEPLKKPPPLLLPAKFRANGQQPNVYSKPAVKETGCSIEDRAVHKFTTNYDSYRGILKRVSDMQLSGSLDSEEPSTGSESSSVRTRSSRSSRDRTHSGCFSDHSATASPYEDESSASSITGSDHCPPYEEISFGESSANYANLPSARSSFVSLPSPPPVTSDIQTFRDSLPPPPSPTALYINEPPRLSYRQTSSESRRQRSRPTSLYSNCEVEPRLSRQMSACSDNRLSTQGQETTEVVTEVERHQIETFFKGLRTNLHVCNSLANLYVTWQGVEGNWTFKHTGVPVVILESGDTQSRRKRRIQIVLAEKGTSFPLWRDTIDNLSSYRKSGHAFHTMHLSSDHRQMIGLSFDSSEDSDLLLNHIEDLTSNPENINISVPGSKKKKKEEKKKKKTVTLPKKEHISKPCLFLHVTSIGAVDKPNYMSLQTLVDKANTKCENIT